MSEAIKVEYLALCACGNIDANGNGNCTECGKEYFCLIDPIVAAMYFCEGYIRDFVHEKEPLNITEIIKQNSDSIKKSGTKQIVESYKNLMERNGDTSD